MTSIKDFYEQHIKINNFN